MKKLLKILQGKIKNEIKGTFINWKQNYKLYIKQLLGFFFALIIVSFIVNIVNNIILLPNIPIELINALITVSSIVLGFAFIALSSIVNNHNNPVKFTKFVNYFVNMTESFVFILLLSLVMLFFNFISWPISIKFTESFILTFPKSNTLFTLFVIIFAFLVHGFGSLLELLSQIKKQFDN